MYFAKMKYAVNSHTIIYVNIMKNYKIITIAPSGAGKTVFLASMFKQLSTQGKHQLYLYVEDAKQRSELNNIYTEITTGEKWPQGTRGDVKEWVFTCRVEDSNLNKYSVCNFTYIDYPGGLITNPETNDFDFVKGVDGAHAVLAILDGTKLLSLVTNKQSKNVEIWLNQELAALAQIIQNCGNIPVHFIISKWDVLHDKYNLQELWGRLLERSSELENVVGLRKNKGVRLIPVSSIGMEFATLQPDGSMKKNPDKDPKPYLLEVPITYAMTDPLEKELKTKVKELKEELEENSNNIFNKLNKIFGKIIGGANDMIEKVPVVNSLSKHLRTLHSIIQGDDYTVHLDEVRDQETALNHAIKCFKKIQEDFEQKFPYSDLGK